MRNWWHRRSVRLQLTLWYVVAMIVVLAVYAASVFTFVSRSVSQSLDDRLRGDFQWAAEMADQRPDGTLTWFESAGNDLEEDNPWLQVWSPAGDLLFRTMVAARQPVPESARLASSAQNRIVAVPTAPAPIRVLSRPWHIGGQPVVIQVARSEALMRRELRELFLMLVLGLPLGVAAAGLGGYWLARHALAPVHRMADRARTITAERLSDRLPVANPNDELGRLAAVVNETLGRLESSFEQMRRFTADVSHELRTPLTAIRSVGEVGLRERRDAAAYRGIIGSMLEEVDRLARLVDRLLAISRAGVEQARFSSEVLDLRELADNVVAHLGVLAEEKEQTLTVDGRAGVRCVGERVVLRQALINLVDNAIKYTPDHGDIRIRVLESPDRAILEVSDTGPGIRPELETRIFRRFDRGGRSSSGISGAGLGLAIATWAVEASGGQLTLENTGRPGATFRISFPQAAAREDRLARHPKAS